MKKNSIVISFLLITALIAFMQCEQKENNIPSPTVASDSVGAANGGFENQVKWGEHLVLVGGCNDCHTPKKMTSHGPDIDSSLLLSGYNIKMPIPDVNRKEMETKGLAVTSDLTSWVGPWGISYAANLTSDTTGIGSWSEEQFIYALRAGKFRGLPNTRTLLPPMPWQMFKYMSDAEIKAIFAYLKATKPIENAVPAAAPPTSAKQ